MKRFVKIAVLTGTIAFVSLYANSCSQEISENTEKSESAKEDETDISRSLFKSGGFGKKGGGGTTNSISHSSNNNRGRSSHSTTR